MANGKRIVVDIQNRIADLATRLDATSPKAAVLLRDLGTAVAGSTSESDWAHADLYRVLNPERISMAYENKQTAGGWVRWFEFLRNVLVLLPLAVTWWGIALAARAYGELVADEPEQASQSFIYLWQEGFGERTWLTLERLAAIDGSILFVVFLLTLILYWYSTTRQNRSRTEAMQVQYDLEEILADADLVLSVSRQPNEYLALQRLLKMSDQVLQSLRQESVRFDKFMYERRTELIRLTDFTSQLEETAKEMVTAVEKLQTVNEQTNSAIDSIALPMNSFNDHSGSFVPAVQETNEKLDRLINVRLDSMIASQMQTIFELQQHMEKQTEQIAQLVDNFPGVLNSNDSLKQDLISSLNGLSAQLQQNHEAFSSQMMTNGQRLAVTEQWIESVASPQS